MRPRRLLVPLLSVLLLALLPSVVPSPAGAAAQGKAARPDLRVGKVTVQTANRVLTVSATVSNTSERRRGQKAGPTFLSVGVYQDPANGRGRTPLGDLPVKALQGKRAATVSGAFALPDSVGSGSRYVVLCADADREVRERNEKNNCWTSAVVMVDPPPPVGPTVTVIYAAAPTGAGTVTAYATNGTCVANPSTGGGVCSVPVGTGTITLTAMPSGPPFAAWTPGIGGPCDGVRSGPSSSVVTFTAPTANKSCTAVFAA